MKSVFISGSIEIKELNSLVIDSLNNIIKNKLQVLVGDAHGIDSAIQRYFSDAQYDKVTVYSITNPPRNIASNNFSIKIIDYKQSNEYLTLDEKEKSKVEFSERKKQTFKDIEMSKIADFYLIIWNKKSEGTKNNILRGIFYNKKIKLIIENKIISNKIINENYINQIYENEKGIGIKKLKYRLDILLGEDNLPSKEFLKKNEELRKIYPVSTKTFLQNLPDYADYIVTSSYKGKETRKYKPSIIIKIKDEIIKYKNTIEENFLFKI